MRVLMISFDRGMLKPGSSGDVVKRHQFYADLIGSLDVVVFAGKMFESRTISSNFRVFPTKSSKLSHYKNATQKAVELAQEKTYDLVITQDFASPAGAKIKKALNIPWVVSIHGVFFDRSWLSLNPIKWFLYYKIKKSINSADGFRVVSPFIEKKLRKWGFGQPILVQPTPVDVKKFIVETKPDNKFSVVLYVGRLSAEKNVELLVKSVKQLPAASYRLFIVGDGPDRQKLERLATGSDNIKFLGAKNHDELVEIYEKGDILVLPSNTDSFGKVLIEAGAAGCALVATRTVGAESIIEDGESGLLVEIGDQKRLEKTLGYLVENKDIVRRLGRGAQEMARQYNSEESYTRVADFWKKIANLR